MEMASEAQVMQLLELGEDCMKTTVDQIIANADWGDINFEAGRGDLEKTFTILNQFKRLPIGFLPDRILQQIVGALQPLQASIDQMRSFSIKQANPGEARDRLVAQYSGQAVGFFAAALLYNCMSCLLEGRRSAAIRCQSCILEE